MSTTDPSRAQDAVSSAYADSRLEVVDDPGRFRLAMQRTQLGGARLDVVDHRGTTAYHMQPPGQVLVVRVLSGMVDVDRATTRSRLGVGGVALLALPDEEHDCRVQDARTGVVGVDVDLLDGLAGEGASRRLRAEPLTPERGRSWQRRVEFVSRTVEDVLAEPLVLSATSRMLGAWLLAAFDPDQQSHDTTRERNDATPATVRRAVAMIEAHPDLDLGVADLARACGVTARTVQLAFRRHLDTTPTAYLRRVRLERVRDELRDAAPGTTTVSGVAARWGFVDASRFSARYRAAYGELPSVTLRRG